MKDYEIVLSEVLKVLSKEFNVFGFNLNLLSIFVGCFILSLVFLAIRKLID